jgi:DNA repair protein RecN (Recombination protein N)
VAAGFLPPAGHPALALLDEHGIEADDQLVLRRVVQADGRSRAFVNDQPVAVGLLKRLAALLVEVQGQHDQVGLADPASHAGLLDAFGALDGKRHAAATAWRDWRAAERSLATAREAIAAAQRDEEFLRHAVEELTSLSPEEGEETELAKERQQLQQGERRAEQIGAALSELQPRDLLQVLLHDQVVHLTYQLQDLLRVRHRALRVWLHVPQSLRALLTYQREFHPNGGPFQFLQVFHIAVQ